jgi:hypothetical protein
LLPGETGDEHIDATLHEGVLTVRVPKTEQAKAKPGADGRAVRTRSNRFQPQRRLAK